MCGGGGDDDGAKEMRRQEAERQAQIAAGTKNVNEAFGSFTDDYYGGIEKAYLDYYAPQLEQQYKDARQQIILKSPGGTANSGFAKRMAELEQMYQQELGAISGRALDTSRGRRAEVEQNRSNLLSQVNTGLKAASAASLAAEQAKYLSQMPSFSPLADIFAQATADVANANIAASNGYKPVTPLVFNKRGNNALNVVN
jgi:hypothetical protein